MCKTLPYWRDYALWRSRLALHAYNTAFADDHSLRGEEPYTKARNVHAFLTQAVLVARVFIPSPQAKQRTRKRAAALCTHLGTNASELAPAISPRNNLDHFDERLDAILDLPEFVVSQAVVVLNSRGSLEEILKGKPALLMLMYLRTESAIVTFSPKGEMTITPLEPIRKELEYIQSQCVYRTELERKQSDARLKKANASLGIAPGQE